MEGGKNFTSCLKILEEQGFEAEHMRLFYADQANLCCGATPSSLNLWWYYIIWYIIIYSTPLPRPQPHRHEIRRCSLFGEEDIFPQGIHPRHKLYWSLHCFRLVLQLFQTTPRLWSWHLLDCPGLALFLRSWTEYPSSYSHGRLFVESHSWFELFCRNSKKSLEFSNSSWYRASRRFPRHGTILNDAPQCSSGSWRWIQLLSKVWRSRCSVQSGRIQERSCIGIPRRCWHRWWPSDGEHNMLTPLTQKPPPRTRCGLCRSPTRHKRVPFGNPRSLDNQLHRHCRPCHCRGRTACDNISPSRRSRWWWSCWGTWPREKLSGQGKFLSRTSRIARSRNLLDRDQIPLDMDVLMSRESHNSCLLGPTTLRFLFHSCCFRTQGGQVQEVKHNYIFRVRLFLKIVLLYPSFFVLSINFYSHNLT